MIQGGCQCGKARYEAASAISDLSHCHCSMCRKLHGAAFATFAAVARDTSAGLQGEGVLRTYASSDKIDRVFCSLCGSQLVVSIRRAGSCVSDHGHRRRQSGLSAGLPPVCCI